MDMQGAGPELSPPTLQPQNLQSELKRDTSTAGLQGDLVGASATRTIGYSAPPPISASGSREASITRGGLLGNRAVQAAGLALATVVLGVGLWLGNAAPVVPVESGPIATPIQETQKTFSLGRVDADAKATAQLAALLKGEKTELDSLNSANAPALKDLEKSSPQMAQEIKQGERVVYRVYLLDFQDEDGDRAELFVDGTSMGTVNLSNAGEEILIPVRRGSPALMKLVATGDGGGGVTVGMISSLGDARTEVLQVGQSEHWQVIVK